MATDPRLDIIGAALADITRSRILCELMDGRAYTNKELACASDVTPQTASVHLQKLEAASLTSSERSGRNIYHRIANEEVAQVLEKLATLSPTDHIRRMKVRAMPEPDALRARSCYNHIAGRLGVAIKQSLISSGILLSEAEAVSISPKGEAWMRKLDISLRGTQDRQKPLAKLCLDWSERKHHLSGPLATAIMDKSLSANWLERRAGSRALAITPLGYGVFAQDFGLSRAAIDEVSDP